MSRETVFDRLKEVDNLQSFDLAERECYVHDEHRWSLAILAEAQSRNVLPSPVDLVLFDAHPDREIPTCLDELSRVRTEGITPEDVYQLCLESLSHVDNDWVKAGMALGIIRDAVVFGVQTIHAHSERIERWTDMQGVSHATYYLPLPDSALGYQGALADAAKQKALQPIWDILGWEIVNGRFRFGKDHTPIWLDIDLDVLAIQWQDHFFPMPDVVINAEFNQQSDYPPTLGWTGRKFVRELLDRAPLISMAREPRFCGGESEADRILQTVDHLFFDDKLGVGYLKEFQTRPAVTTDAVVFADGGLVMVRRKFEPFKGGYALPGGFMETGETTEQSCARELKEETNLTAQKLTLIGVYSDPSRDPRRHTVTVAYLVEADVADLRAGDDAAEVEIVRDVDSIEIAFDHRQIIEDALKLNGKTSP